MYVGRTEYGRTVRADSLAECVDELAAISHRNPKKPVAIPDPTDTFFYVYSSQETAEANPLAWFASIEMLP